ncbi:c-type cytochrome [Calothrix sp. PCC 6303]|uniref:c-type cytochrome n=1 Tax=Calothrix sp. PCC 6303 TaxID=1170562 RepID=UPI000686EC6D|nr:c-type cytochrome [Calothrix sp. PCC 6303]
MVLFTVVQPVTADTLNSNGAKIFESNCAGCHINGGNIIRRGKNLKLKVLRKNNMDSVDAISVIVANGKNNMSAYQDRLTVEEIQAVSTYVLQQAENNWK